MKKFLLILFNLFLLVAVIALAFRVGKAWIDKQGQNSENGSETSEKIKSGEYPPHAPELTEWQAVNPQDPQSITQVQFDTYLRASGSATIQPLPLLGREWINIQTIKSENEFSEMKLISHYLVRMESDGWKYTIAIDGENFSGVAANGPLGNVISYIKVVDNKLQLFVMSTQRESTTCPCKVTTRILLTNPVPISTALTNQTIN